jgi:hypothetical protein
MILERVHPQDRPSVKTALGAAANGEGIDVERRLLRVNLTLAASVCLVGKRWDQQSNVQSVVSAQEDPD